MYEIKGRISEEDSCHWVIENAADVAEALQTATDNGMYEIFAIFLSRVKETFPNQGKRTWFKATIKEERMVDAGRQQSRTKVRKVTYQVLTQANDLNEASRYLKSQLQQGYNFEMSGLVETDIDDVL